MQRVSTRRGLFKSEHLPRSKRLSVSAQVTLFFHGRGSFESIKRLLLVLSIALSVLFQK